MSKLRNKVLQLFRAGRRYYRDYRKSYGHPVKLFNSQVHDLHNHQVDTHKPITDHWLHQFITNRIKLSGRDTLSIFGVNGDKIAIRVNRSRYKLFFTIENVHNPFSPWTPYQDLLIPDPAIHLSLGFDYIEHPDYLRFPYWLMTAFEPTDTLTEIKNKCVRMNKMSLAEMDRSKFCAFICRADYFGQRSFFADEVEKAGALNFPGAFRHNDDSHSQNSLSKIEYLKQFKFNLCPENTNTRGYVTEKIFDALQAGCIPIYWGADNNPEPEILNKEAIMFLSDGEDNAPVIEQIRAINGNKGFYRDFLAQNRLHQDSPYVIADYFQQLEQRLKSIIAGH